MAEKTEQIYVPRFENTPMYYKFGGRIVKNTVASKQKLYQDIEGGKKLSYLELHPYELYVDFSELHETYSIDDCFIEYQPNAVFCQVWDKPMMTQSDWWKLNETEKKLIEFKPALTLWDYVPKKADKEKSNIEAKVFDMIQNTLNEEDKFVQNRFVSYQPMLPNRKLQSYKTGVVFKTRPGVFDLLVMNGRYDFIMWYFINGSYEGVTKGKGLNWLNAYLQNVKEKRNAYIKSQYSNSL